MAIKIKPAGPKTRRRGNRLIVTQDDERVVYLAQPDRRLQIIEVSRTDLQLTVTSHGRFTMATWKDNGIQIVSLGDYFGPHVAFREKDDDPWIFLNPNDPDCMFISVSDCGIANAALKLSLAEWTIDRDLAELLDVLPMLCDIDRLEEVHTNPRWKSLREFKFAMDRSAPVDGTGRRAESKFRHEFTNWDAMLETAGGLLYPEQYAQVRKGVDQLVTSVIQAASRMSSDRGVD